MRLEALALAFPVWRPAQLYEDEEMYCPRHNLEDEEVAGGFESDGAVEGDNALILGQRVSASEFSRAHLAWLHQPRARDREVGRYRACCRARPHGHIAKQELPAVREQTPAGPSDGAASAGAHVTSRRHAARGIVTYPPTEQPDTRSLVMAPARRHQGRCSLGDERGRRHLPSRAASRRSCSRAGPGCETPGGQRRRDWSGGFSNTLAHTRVQGYLWTAKSYLLTSASFVDDDRTSVRFQCWSHEPIKAARRYGGCQSYTTGARELVSPLAGP